MTRLHALWFLAALAAVPAPASAAPSARDTMVVPLPGVEVTALRGRDRIEGIPAAAFVLGREDIRRAGSPRLSTLLQYVPGMFAYGQTSSGDATIVDPRGFTASGLSSYLKVLIDGQDVRDLENGNVDWDWVAPGNVDRIEVVQGPGAWIHGDASEGGIVNVVLSPTGDRLAEQIDARGGSFGLRSGSLSVSGPAADAQVGGHAFGRQVDGWRTHSRERVYGGGGDAHVPWLGRAITLSASVLDANRQDPGALTADAFAQDPSQVDTPLDYTHARRGHLEGSIQSAAGPEPAWMLRPYFRIEQVDQVASLYSQTPLYQSQFHHTQGSTGGADLDWHAHRTIAGRAVVLQGGAEFEQGSLRSEYNAFDATAGKGALDGSIHSFRTLGALFVGSRIEIDPATAVRLSVRGDLARIHSENGLAGVTTRTRTLTAVSPLLGVTRQVGAEGTAYASVSTAFRVPTLAQLYDQRPTFAFGNTFILSNGELDPQRATSVEVGGRWSRPAGASAQLAAYSTWVRNEIDFDLATFRYANISRSWHRGVEGQLDFPLPARLDLRAGGAYTPTTFDGDGPENGKQINGVPLATGTASLRWAPISAVSAEFGARLLGRQFLDKQQGEPIPAIAAWDAGIAGHSGRWAATVRLLNVFDRRYAESGYIGAVGEQRVLPAAPRSVNVALSFE